MEFIAQLTKSYKGWRDACGEYSDITTSLQQLLNLIRQVHDEASKKDSILTRASQDKEALNSILQSSAQAAKELGDVINDYRALGHGKSRERNWKDLQKNWKRFKFGTKDLNGLRFKLQQSVNMISAHLTAAGVGALSRVELDVKALPDQIQQTIDGLAAEIRAGRRDGSVMTTYDDDEGEVWRQFRRELIGEGMRSSMIHRYKPRIKTYLRTLAEEGLLEESELDSEAERTISRSQGEDDGRAPRLLDPIVDADVDERSQRTETCPSSGLQATCITDDEDEDEEAKKDALKFPAPMRSTNCDHLGLDNTGGHSDVNDHLLRGGMGDGLPQQPVEASSSTASIKSPGSKPNELIEDLSTHVPAEVHADMCSSRVLPPVTSRRPSPQRTGTPKEKHEYIERSDGRYAAVRRGYERLRISAQDAESSEMTTPGEPEQDSWAEQNEELGQLPKPNRVRSSPADIRIPSDKQNRRSGVEKTNALRRPPRSKQTTRAPAKTHVTNDKSPAQPLQVHSEIVRDIPQVKRAETMPYGMHKRTTPSKNSSLRKAAPSNGSATPAILPEDNTSKLDNTKNANRSDHVGDTNHPTPDGDKTRVRTSREYEHHQIIGIPMLALPPSPPSRSPSPAGAVCGDSRPARRVNLPCTGSYDDYHRDDPFVRGMSETEKFHYRTGGVRGGGFGGFSDPRDIFAKFMREQGNMDDDDVSDGMTTGPARTRGKSRPPQQGNGNPFPVRTDKFFRTLGPGEIVDPKEIFAMFMKGMDDDQWSNDNLSARQPGDKKPEAQRRLSPDRLRSKRSLPGDTWASRSRSPYLYRTVHPTTQDNSSSDDTDASSSSHSPSPMLAPRPNPNGPRAPPDVGATAEPDLLELA